MSHIGTGSRLVAAPQYGIRCPAWIEILLTDGVAESSAVAAPALQLPDRDFAKTPTQFLFAACSLLDECPDPRSVNRLLRMA